MAAENPLPFLRRLEQASGLPAAALIWGPQAFLREYVLAALSGSLAREVGETHHFQLGPGNDFGAALDEVLAPGLFAARKLVICRVLRSRRERIGAEEATEAQAARTGADEAALEREVARGWSAGYLILLYEGTPPARLRHLLEQHGVVVNCAKPFDNQLAQYAQTFARRRELRLGPAAAELLVARYGADLAAMNNVLGLAAIHHRPGDRLEPADFREPEPCRTPEVFELADSLARGQAMRAFALLDRSLAVGRDPFELLALELVPSLRRMMVAASLVEGRQSAGAELARALGGSPASPLVARALEGARRFGSERLARAYSAAAQLDAGFKMGLIRGREQALSRLILELLAA